jgi:hypothetical protein
MTPFQECRKMRRSLLAELNTLNSNMGMSINGSNCGCRLFKSKNAGNGYFSLSIIFFTIKIIVMITIWRRLQFKLKKKGKQEIKANKSVRFYTVDTVYYTHSSSEYDRTPSEEDFSAVDYFSL